MTSFESLRQLFLKEGRVVVPPGTYEYIPGQEPILLRSGQRVEADGACFRFPNEAPDDARWIFFAGQDLVDFHWIGGSFHGHCFNPEDPNSSWGPAVNSRAIVVETTKMGKCERLTFEQLHSKELGGAVVSVFGRHAPGTNREVLTYADRISVRNCEFQQSGKFMWDYGFLWQILGWPEHAQNRELRLAEQYFPSEFIDPEARVDVRSNRILVDDPAGWSDVCLFGPESPEDPRGIRRLGNLIHGKRYFVCERGVDWIRLSEKPEGTPLELGDIEGRLTVIQNLHEATMALYAPRGSGPGKGSVDLTACRGIQMSGNRLSARGDTMHIHSSRDSVISNNHIQGSRMGAFFLSEWCSHTTATGNLVEGTQGSRVLSIEKSNTDCVVTGNTFRGGGRGSWINQPQNLVLAGNIFLNNTSKCEIDPTRGRRNFLTGGYESWAEIYFTTHEPGASYGPAVVQGNLIETGPGARSAVEFSPGWKAIQFQGNQIGGATTEVIWKV